MLNPFETDAFSVVSLTAAINLLPNNYGLIRQRNLMPVKGVYSRQILVEEQSGRLVLLSTMPPGSPGQQYQASKRKVRSLVIPHIPHDAVLLPQDYAGVRAFGTENEVYPYARLVNDKLQGCKNNHAITLEHLRMGALKGIILDADGSTLYNLYNEFEIVQATVDFALSTESTDVLAKCLEVTRTIEDNLQGEVMSGVSALVSSEFFDLLIAHASVKEKYLNYAEGAQKLSNDPRKDFRFGGISFTEYRGWAPDKDGNTRRFIASGEGHCYPEGTIDTFRTVCAPADFLETVNTEGLEIYAKLKVRDFERGVHIHTQSNPLPICFRPGVLIKITA